MAASTVLATRPITWRQDNCLKTAWTLQELTAAQKKKLKKKAKDKAKKADGDEGGKKGPVKKESAAVRKLREEMERQKAAEEAAQRAEEERIRKVQPFLIFVKRQLNLSTLLRVIVS